VCGIKCQQESNHPKKDTYYSQSTSRLISLRFVLSRRVVTVSCLVFPCLVLCLIWFCLVSICLVYMTLVLDFFDFYFSQYEEGNYPLIGVRLVPYLSGRSHFGCGVEQIEKEVIALTRLVIVLSCDCLGTALCVVL
jgi:hypothetical protein